jgi:hypothetical protein
MSNPRNYLLFIVLVVAVVGWFALGTQFNIRKGHKVLAWLQGGLKLLGEKTTMRWLGSAVVELKIENAKEPFRSAEILVVLEPRDVAPLWGFYRLRRRRDLLIIRARLRRLPSFEFEALESGGWSTRGIEQQLQFRNWDRLPLPDNSLLTAYAAGGAPAAAELIALATPPESPLCRLAIRRTEPHLELHWKLESARQVSAQTLIETLRRIPERLV